MDSSERDRPVIGHSELIWTRIQVKTNCLKLVIFRNGPLSIHWLTALTGLSKTVTLFDAKLIVQEYDIKYIFIS